MLKVLTPKLERLRDELLCLADKGYQGIAKLHLIAGIVNYELALKASCFVQEVY